MIIVIACLRAGLSDLGEVKLIINRDSGKKYRSVVFSVPSQKNQATIIMNHTTDE